MLKKEISILEEKLSFIIPRNDLHKIRIKELEL